MPHDWRDSLRLAADLALLGIVVTLLSLPLVTAGAAVATGSHAIHHVLTKGRWPSLADCWTVFRGRLRPGLVAGPAVVAATVLVVIDVAALRHGAVPGGAPVLTVVLAAAALGAGYVALVAVQSGTAAGASAVGAAAGVDSPAGAAARIDCPAVGAAAGIDCPAVGVVSPAVAAGIGSPVGAGAGRGAARSALALATARPAAPLAAAGVLAVAAVLAVFVHPALIPVLAGYVLFGLHVVTPRVAGRRPVSSAAGDPMLEG